MAGDQDMFDAVVMADERFHGEGYREGYEEGSSLGMIEGRQHGTLHGAKIGSEIGCYQGFAFAWRGLLHSCATERDSLSEVVLSSVASSIHCGFEGSPPDFVTIITACWRMVTCFSMQEWCCV
ncbi:protein LTO1 homolog isoform X3 [Bos javanicus]|uniref:protein LTO1 homolog isoform X3 n=1 Tax=Bos javanicus TaxID=9906 RepID=UPI002AA6D731|nr:protein LTO1 homolog isoform X3 [Bos javanicus]